MLKSNVKIFAITVTLIYSTIMLLSVNTSASIKMDRKIVVFNNSESFVEKEALLKKHGAEKVKNLSCINGMVVKLPKDSKLKDEKGVDYIEDDIVLSIAKKTEPIPVATPNPTITPSPLSNEVIPWGIEYMEAPLYWGSSDTENIKVGIVDSGIDLDHPDLVANIKGGFNAIAKNKSADDDNGHGTYVAGIVAASKNEFGIVGMVPNADLYAIKVLDSIGNGYTSAIIEGIDWAIKNNIDILNMSFGTVNNLQSLHDIIIKAYKSGVTMVAAAGNNNGRNSEYPAAYPEVISVGAINKDGCIASFSAISGVDIFGPGVEIYSTSNDGLFETIEGTSFAAPHICGKLIYQK